MPVKKIGVIINPSSGGGSTLRRWPEFENMLNFGGFQITSYISTSETDFRVHARAFAARFRHIAVCGGDSSLTIAAEELYQQKFNGELAFLPAGSANDIVLDIREQRAPRSKTLWLGELSAGRLQKDFIGQANWGLGVVVNRWVGAILSRMPFLRRAQNLLGILSIIFARLFGCEAVHAEIVLDKEKISGHFSILLVTQIRHWASGLRFAPAADWYAPEFEVIAIRRCGFLRLIRIILAAKTGSHLQYPEVLTAKSRNVRLVFSEPVAVQIDGDILRQDGTEVHQAQYKLKKRKSTFTLTGS